MTVAADPALPAPMTSEPPEVDVEAYLRTDEEALRRAAPWFAVGRVREPCIVSIGVGTPESTPSVGAARAAQIPVVRRRTGGTVLLHRAGDLLWSIVLPRSDPRAGRDFARAYGRFGRPLVVALAACGIEAEWAPSPGLSEEYCTLGHRGEVLLAGGRVVGGAAQHLTASALLHQGTVSARVDHPVLDRLLGWPSGGLGDRLAGIDELTSRPVSGRCAEELRTRLAELVANPTTSLGSG